MTGAHDEELLQSICDFLRPYRWRGFRPELMARAILAARDREHVHRLLAHVPGASVGAWEELGPVDLHDVRVPVLVGFLVSHRWTELNLGALCRQLLTVLDERGSHR